VFIFILTGFINIILGERLQ